MTCRFFSLVALFSALVFEPLTQARGAESVLSDQACAWFGKQIAYWITVHDVKSVRSSFDEAALLGRMLHRMNLSIVETIGFGLGVSHVDLLQNLRSIRRAQFLRVVLRNGEKRALIRVHTQKGVDYYEFVCARAGTGKMKWIDMYMYSVGDTLSSFWQNNAMLLMAEGKKDLLLQKLGSADNSYLRQATDLQRATTLLNNGEPAAAAKIFESLPPDLQNTRMVLFGRLQCSEQDGNRAEYLKVVRDWRKAYPDDPSLALISIDADILAKDYAGALRDVDTLDRLVGGDPYQNCTRAIIYFAEKNYVAAKQAANRAIQADRDYYSAYDVLLGISLNEGNFGETARILEAFERVFPRVDMATAIKKDPAYAKFLLSPAYAGWIERRLQMRP